MVVIRIGLAHITRWGADDLIGAQSFTRGDRHRALRAHGSRAHGDARDDKFPAVKSGRVFRDQTCERVAPDAQTKRGP
ncbi:unnamed protein product, partial [Iphiclides podalirius]